MSSKNVIATTIFRRITEPNTYCCASLRASRACRESEQRLQQQLAEARAEIAESRRQQELTEARLDGYFVLFLLDINCVLLLCSA